MQAKQRVLTGITTSGTPHLGNYLGALKPAVAASQKADTDSFYFLADYHALIKCQDPQTLHRSSQEIAAIWLALGLDTDKATFYRQSDIPEIPQLAWFLTCMTAKGMMNRSHAYKASVDENQRQSNTDLDQGINMGLFSYPILMAADILMFNAHQIPVGKDQIQHIEMCRDIAMRFNHTYGEHFVLPEAMVEEGDSKVLSGLDGRKMSKSYGNIIPLFAPADELKKLIFQITTNSLQPGQVKDPETCTLFEIYSAFASEQETLAMRNAYANGIGWGDMKGQLFEYLNEYLTPARKRYDVIIKDPSYIEAELQKGATKARAHSQPFMQRLRSAVGIMSFVGGMESKHSGSKVKKELTQQEQIKADAGKAKAVAIAKQRAEQEIQEVSLKVDALMNGIKESGDAKTAAITAMTQLKLQIDSAKKKAKKTLQLTLELLEKRLEN
ncbi:tryptophan--tRNA ligase [Oceanospirillaceae bacterium]|jgi:tryptophanyl-tRNA synthetase|nr:tryptophan--tRNA ligase [Oceanospirillaceae bacterium]MDB9957767.1 tryptophan--tRNA ligase [Oceanospirillaceae bacterium]MDC1341608.1 tryptophan--tRNA ligase [Oceanospirillaceae bacterium]|tara:strand:- start:9057 stop:10379 length:1323 start_codon:yes stop_codon:yes gene_type:complete